LYLAAARGLDRIQPDPGAGEREDTPERLTRREIDVLRLMTVKNHTSSILAKLAVRDRTRAVLKALELGYL